MQVLTLTIPVCEQRVLLGMKRRGFGAGRWNGFGGKVEEGESISAAARREVHEEVGIKDGDLVPAGRLTFTYQSTGDVLQVWVFSLTDFSDTAHETEEMSPQWFTTTTLPLEYMWPDDRHWIPLFLAGQLFVGDFVLDEPSLSATILRHTLAAVPTLPENSALE